MVNTGRDDALGRLFKRCTKCGGKIADRRCAKCQSDSFSWAYVVDVARAGEKREQRTKAGFKTKADAVEALAELQTSKAAGTYVEANKATLGEFLDSWVKGLDARPWTRRGYESVIRRHIKPHLGSRPLQSVGKVEIRALYTELRLTGNVRGKKAGGSLSEKSVHNVHICLRAALNTAVENGLLRSNPAARALERPRAQAEIQTWTADELNTFLAFCREDRHFPLYRLAAFSGMRRGELLGLRWSDMKWNLSSLSVQRQLGLDTDNDGTKDLVAPKTSHGRRSISLDGECGRSSRTGRLAKSSSGVHGRWISHARLGVLPGGRIAVGRRHDCRPVPCQGEARRPPAHPLPRPTPHPRNPPLGVGRRYQRREQATRSR